MTLEIRVSEIIRVRDIIPNIKWVVVRVIEFVIDFGRRFTSIFVPKLKEGRAPPKKQTGSGRKEVVAKKG